MKLCSSDNHYTTEYLQKNEEYPTKNSFSNIHFLSILSLLIVKSLELKNWKTFSKFLKSGLYINHELPVLEPLGWVELKWKLLKGRKSRNFP